MRDHSATTNVLRFLQYEVAKAFLMHVGMWGRVCNAAHFECGMASCAKPPIDSKFEPCLTLRSSASVKCHKLLASVNQA